MLAFFIDFWGSIGFVRFFGRGYIVFHRHFGRTHAVRPYRKTPENSVETRNFRADLLSGQ